MKVFLSGKIDREFGSWRDELVGGREILWGQSPHWEIVHELSEGIVQWHPLEGAIFGVHDYVGPFRQIPIYCCEQGPGCKHSGSFHGTTNTQMHGQLDPSDWPVVAENCLRAIRSADIVFAYINSPDAYGTIAEIGYAVALGKFVSLLVNPSAPFEYDDFWFVGELVAHGNDQTNPLVWEDWDGLNRDENQVVRDALKDAFIAHAAWRPPTSLTPVPLHETQQAKAQQQWIADAVQTFKQIGRWTSDPRVRDEVQRLTQRAGS